MPLTYISKKNGSSFEVMIHGKKYEVTVPVPGRHFIYNALAAIELGLTYDVPMEHIIKGISEFSLTKRRMEILRNEQNITIINDCYNSSYESVKAALEYMGAFSGNRRVAVLGDVLELGKFSKEMHQKIGEEVLNNQIDILLTVGEEAQIIAEVVRKANTKREVYDFSNNKEAIEKLKQVMQSGDIILVKASHSMHFEEIVEAIQ